MKPDCTRAELPHPALSAAAVRARLNGKRGRDYWRSLDELAATAEFNEFLGAEFPRHFWAGANHVNRRDFLKLLGASLALAGLAGCARQPDDKIVPYVDQPENMTLGKPLHFATATTLNGYGCGVLVESHEGRPTKIEGNPRHPGSLGASDAITQAQLLSLYDPDRSADVLHRGELATWDDFVSAMVAAMHQHRTGEGVYILTETVTSPTLVAQIQQLLAAYPQARHHVYEPVNRDNARAGALSAFGEDINTIYHFDRADTVLSLDADFLLNQPGSVRYAHDFMAGRRIRAADVAGHRAAMNRLYTVESSATLTGAMADQRWPLSPRHIETFVRELAGEMGVSPKISLSSGVPEQWLKALAGDMLAHRGTSLVVAGREQTPAVHALAHFLNERMGNVGNTVTYTAPVEAVFSTTSTHGHGASLRELADAIQAGKVETLLIIGANPAFTAPADVPMADLLTKVATSIHLGSHQDETAAQCVWHVPQTHELENWSDTRAYDGTVTIMQPLIAPLFAGKSVHEVLAVLLGRPNRTAFDIVRETWQRRHPQDFEAFWRASLYDGVVSASTLPVITPQVRADFSASPPTHKDSAGNASTMTAQRPSTLEIVFRPSPNIWDGRFASNGWLQELPQPLTTLTWDNTAQISPATADRFALQNEDVVLLRLHGRSVEAPIWIVPGLPDDTVTVHFGYGRSRAGQVGTDVGFNAYALRRGANPWFDAGLEMIKTGRRYSLSPTQNHHHMEGRDFVVTGTLEEFKRRPTFARAEPDRDIARERPSLYPDFPYNGHKWGMSIDLNTCIGCNACTMACQAENNIPVVGKEEVGRGREMHWIRVDTYFEGDPANPHVCFQPVPCMHCEKAPCEPVCPTGATQHSREGLNEMIYNRCIGTRYCSNNCPYKVRRFNFLQYTRFSDKPTLKMLQNPDVTVRNRGVMEKCTYCVQRIESAKIEAEKAGRALRDGEVVTACQQACPTNAIVFGDLNDRRSQVAQLHAEPLTYGLLLELNTKPRTTYLARLRNPHPLLEKEEV